MHRATLSPNHRALFRSSTLRLVSRQVLSLLQLHHLVAFPAIISATAELLSHHLSVLAISYATQLRSRG